MTGIEWTDTTWNPVTGCDRISAGCDNCYALALAKRLKAMGSEKYQNDGDPRTSGPGFGVTVHPAALRIPRRWRTPRRVFVNSMSDLFHARVPAGFVGEVFEVMRETPQHTYQVLTKRPLRARRLVERGLEVPPNVWLGVSVEDQSTADDRIPHLQSIPALTRFLSCEPLLGPVDLDRHLYPRTCPCGCGGRVFDDREQTCDGCGGLCADWPTAAGLDWVIVGGESGPNARPVHPEWVRALRDQCTGAKVAFFLKQWGGRTPKAAGRELDGQIWNQYPTDRSITCHA